MAVAALVAFRHEIYHILVCGRERQVLSQDWLDVLRCDDLPVALVEEAEALLGLLVLARLRANALVPAVGDHVLHEGEIDGVALEDLRIALLELLLDVSRSHLVEAEVLEDVAEEVVGDGVLALHKIVVEALLQIGGHFARQVASGRPFWSLCDVKLEGGLRGRCFLSGHFVCECVLMLLFEILFKIIYNR